MVLIKQATFGDETSATDVTQSLASKVTNGYLSVVADSKLLPMVTLNSGTTTLTADDIAKSKQDAIAQCGGNGHDENCINERSAKIQQTLLQQRTAEANASDKTIVGRRLTATIVDDYGNEKTVQVPDGQTFTLGNPPASATASSGGSWVTFFLSFFGVLWIAVLICAWVFSVVATYRTLIDAGYRIPAYIGTATAVLIPYSGFFIMFFYYFFMTYWSSS
jgi:hypothetical protein